MLRDLIKNTSLSNHLSIQSIDDLKLTSKEIKELIDARTRRVINNGVITSSSIERRTKIIYNNAFCDLRYFNVFNVFNDNDEKIITRDEGQYTLSLRVVTNQDDRRVTCSSNNGWGNLELIRISNDRYNGILTTYKGVRLRINMFMINGEFIVSRRSINGRGRSRVILIESHSGTIVNTGNTVTINTNNNVNRDNMTIALNIARGT